MITQIMMKTQMRTTQNKNAPSFFNALIILLHSNYHLVDAYPTLRNWGCNSYQLCFRDKDIKGTNKSTFINWNFLTCFRQKNYINMHNLIDTTAVNLLLSTVAVYWSKNTRKYLYVQLISISKIFQKHYPDPSWITRLWHLGGAKVPFGLPRHTQASTPLPHAVFV